MCGRAGALTLSPSLRSTCRQLARVLVRLRALPVGRAAGVPARSHAAAWAIPRPAVADAGAAAVRLRRVLATPFWPSGWRVALLPVSICSPVLSALRIVQGVGPLAGREALDGLPVRNAVRLSSLSCR